MTQRLRRVLRYVEEHLTEDISVADLADCACLSVFHFARAFAATMGMPPHRYVSQRRLENAKAMIASGHASLAGDVPFDCRFARNRASVGLSTGDGRDASGVPARPSDGVNSKIVETVVQAQIN